MINNFVFVAVHFVVAAAVFKGMRSYLNIRRCEVRATRQAGRV